MPPVPRPRTMQKRSLWKNYFSVLGRPSAVFEQEKPYSSWAGIFRNLLIYYIPLGSVVLLLSLVFIKDIAKLTGLPTAFLVTRLVTIFVIYLGVAFASFFISQLIIFGFSKLFKGKALFKEQAYLSSFFMPVIGIIICILITIVLLTLPAAILSTFIPSIPSISFGGALIWLALLSLLVLIGFSIYSIVLQVKSLRIAHSYSSGKAFLSWFLSVVIFVVISVVVGIISVLIQLPTLLSGFKTTLPGPSFEEKTFYDCGINETCFSEHLMNCSLAKVTLTGKTQDFNVTYRQESLGWENNECKVKFTLLKMEPEIPGIALKNKWVLCKIPKNDLANYKAYLTEEEKMRQCEGPLIELISSAR